jgi:hypothetical protein
MKRLLGVSIVVLMTLALVGCSRPWGSWLNRGSRCDRCSSMPVMEGEYIAPPSQLPPPEVLP